MVRYKLRADMDEINVEESYRNHPTLFSIKLFYGGFFTKFPGRKYLNGKEKYVDLVDIDTFCVHDIDDIMEMLECVEEGKLLFYHFKVPLSDLDVGLYALGSDADIMHLGKYVASHKLIEVYIEHGRTNLHTYYVSPTPTRVRIQEFVQPPSCSRRLFLKWKDSEIGETGERSGCNAEVDNMQVQTGDCSEVPVLNDPIETVVPVTEEVPMLNELQTPPATMNAQEETHYSDFQTPPFTANDYLNMEDFIDRVQTPPFEFDLNGPVVDEREAPQPVVDEHEAPQPVVDEHEAPHNDFELDGDDDDEGIHDDSDDSDFEVEAHNIIDDPEVDMREFFLHIDKDVEWVGNDEGSHGMGETSRDIGEVEVLNPDAFSSDSSADEGGTKKRRRSIKAIRRAHENKEANVSDAFYVFQTFSTPEALKDKIRKHAVETRREIELVKNDKNRIKAVCKGSKPDLGVFNPVNPTGPSQCNLKGQRTPNASTDVEGKCPWVLYASKWKADADWEVQTYKSNHDCLQTRNVKSCTYKFLSKQIMQQIQTNPTVPTRSLQEQLVRDYEVDLSKMKVFRAKSEALNQIRGDYAGQYALLRDYIFELQTRNPNTTVKIEVENEPNHASLTRTFKRIYVCLGPLKKGFAAGKRDYLGLDGCFMKGPYPGFILTAVGLDGNSSTYPVAYAVVESENMSSWTWFLSCLGDDINLERESNFTFVSDRQKGLLQAISKLFPCAEHRFCVRHIQENMKKNWKAKVFKDALWKCATVSTVQEFHHAMEELRQLNNDCYQWLKSIEAHHWARSHFTGRAHCDGLLNHLCETINNQLEDARDQPIITSLEFIREYLMLRIVKIQKEIDKAPGPLTPTATTILEKIKTDAAQYKGVFCGNGKYQVSGPSMDQCVVDMVNNTCSCRKWELTGIPCKHAVVAIWDMRNNKKDIGLPESWVHPTYWLKTWKEMYSFKIEPINGRRMWAKYACPTTLVPPNHHVTIGRPKKKRRKSVVELEDMVRGGRASRKEKSVTCSKCNNVGHNKRSCKGQLDGRPSAGGDGEGSSRANAAGQRRSSGGGASNPSGAGKRRSTDGQRKSSAGGAGRKGKKVV